MINGYYLVSKLEKVPFHKYKGNALRLVNQTPMTYDEVIVGLKNKPEKYRKITTFRDSDSNIIERCFDYSDEPYKNRIYKHYDNIIKNSEYVDSTHIKEYTLNRRILSAYHQLVENGCERTILWNPVKFLTNHFSQNIKTGEKVLSQVLQKNLMKPKKEIHAFIEYPHIVKNKIENKPQKILQFMVNTLNNNNVVEGTFYGRGVEIPKLDSFLGIRALDIEDSKEVLCNRYLKERKISNLGIKIYPQYLPQEESEELAKALFNPNDGSINFVKCYKFKSKANVVSTARHEVEHGWQYFLHALNTGGSTPWEVRLAYNFGKLPNKLKKEAESYTKSIQSYVSLGQNPELYKKNYIEKKAGIAGNLEKNLYEFEQIELLNQFRHIPKELL